MNLCYSFISQRTQTRNFWLHIDQRLPLWPLHPSHTLQCLFPIIIQFNVITMEIRFPAKYLSDMVVWVPGCVELVPLGRPERQLD